MTVIRLTRMGRNKKPFYRMVVTDSKKEEIQDGLNQLVILTQ